MRYTNPHLLYFTLLLLYTFFKTITPVTRRALGRVHLPPTKVFQRLTVNKTILKPRLAAAINTLDFPRRKIPRTIAYTIVEKAIWFRHPNYNPDRAQKLISSSMSRHWPTRNISSESMHVFLSNLANRQIVRQTWANAFTSSFVGGN